MLNLAVIDSVVVLLQEPQNIGLVVLLDKGLIVSRLWVEHRSFWLELAHSINCLDFSQNDFTAAFLVLDE